MSNVNSFMRKKTYSDKENARRMKLSEAWEQEVKPILEQGKLPEELSTGALS